MLLALIDRPQELFSGGFGVHPPELAPDRAAAVMDPSRWLRAQSPRAVRGVVAS